MNFIILYVCVCFVLETIKPKKKKQIFFFQYRVKMILAIEWTCLKTLGKKLAIIVRIFFLKKHRVRVDLVQTIHRDAFAWIKVRAYELRMHSL